MGHIRLGKIPTNKRWKDVVALITAEVVSDVAGHDTLAADVEQIASQTLTAAQFGLQLAIADKGLRFTFFMLTQLVLASRHDDWMNKLQQLGIKLPPKPGLFDLTSSFQHCIDDYISRHATTTDISEIAQLAATEAISHLIAPRAQSLFGTGPEEVRVATKELSTKKGFSDLGQLFFGRFMARYLNFYLSRVTAAQTGKGGLRQVGELTTFNDALSLHCKQSARIVHDFCGEWYSKTEFKEGISLANTSRFMAVALKKLEAELNRQESDA